MSEFSLEAQFAQIAKAKGIMPLTEEEFNELIDKMDDESLIGLYPKLFLYTLGITSVVQELKQFSKFTPELGGIYDEAVFNANCSIFNKALNTDERRTWLKDLTQQAIAAQNYLKHEGAEIFMQGRFNK